MNEIIVPLIQLMNKYSKKYIIMLVFLVFSLHMQGQQDSLKNAKELIFYKSSDSIPSLALDSVYILPKMRFQNYKALKHYRWLRRKVYKVYPFAKMSGDNLVKLDERLVRMDSKRKRKRYIKIVQKWIEKEFEPKLKNLSQSEGRILSKLIHRQTSHTVYYSLKKYKSGWTAFWYQRLAKLYNVDLKAKFDPFNNQEDYWIEYILQRAFQEEILEPQDNKLGYKFDDLKDKWKPKSIPVKRIKDIQKRINNTPINKITNKQTTK